MNTMINDVFWQSRKNDDRHMNDDLKVDRFATTAHIETVCCLYHQKKDFISVPYEPQNTDYLQQLK